MATELQKQLRPASFRGVAFFIEPQAGIGLEGGRRLQVHEYPQRDKPYTQDLGRAARELQFEAFVLGADYIAQSQALLAALEGYGPGKLVHPWLGELTVNVQNYRIRYTHELGQARLQISVVESGELTFPAVVVSTAQSSRSAATNLQTTANAWFGKVVAVLGFVNRVAVAALATYARVLKFLGNPVGSIMGLFGAGTQGLQGNLASLVGLFGTPIKLAWSFSNLLNISSKASDGSLVANAFTAAQRDAIYLSLIQAHVAMATDPALSPPAPTNSLAPSAKQLAANDNAIFTHTRLTLLANAVGLSSLVEGVIYDDTLTARQALLGALDAEALAANDDDVFQALQTARSAVFADLSDKMRDSARLVNYTVPSIRPALVIAYDLYEDTEREAEIIARNHIQHPGFVRGVLKVLSR